MKFKTKNDSDFFSELINKVDDYMEKQGGNRFADSSIYMKGAFLIAGIATGLSLYSYMHVWLHKPWASKWIGGLQKFHMQHHFGQTEKCFGVTNTLWDKIFNTAGKTEKTASAKSIELYFGKTKEHNLITHKQAV